MFNSLTNAILTRRPIVECRVWSENAGVPHSTLRALYADISEDNSKTARRAVSGMHGDAAPRENTEIPKEEQKFEEDNIRPPQDEDCEETATHKEEKDRGEPENNEEQELREQAKIPEVLQKKRPGRTFPAMFGRPFRTLFVLGLIALLLLLWLWWFYGFGSGHAFPGSANLQTVRPATPSEEEPPKIENKENWSIPRELHIVFMPPENDAEHAKDDACRVFWIDAETGSYKSQPLNEDNKPDFERSLEKVIRAWNAASAPTALDVPIVVIYMKPFPGQGLFEKIEQIVREIDSRISVLQRERAPFEMFE